MSQRSYLFIHQNMPAQFLHICQYLRDQGHRIVFITRNQRNEIRNVTKVVYKPTRGAREDAHPYLKSYEDAILHGQSIFRSITNLKKKHDFTPDVVVGHAGWGETLFVKDALPDVPLLNYFEFYYNPRGQDFGFDPEIGVNLDSQLSLRIKNSVALQAHAGCDWGLTPTQWQYNTHPVSLQSRMSVIHEGVDTERIRPNPEATYTTESGKVLRAGQKIVTFISRSLENYRGFHTFMRALPEMQRRHPDADFLIVGNEGVSYGPTLPEGDSYKKRMLKEVSFDPSTVHFTGTLEWERFRAVMHVSAAHVYLTYPFVLSWSMLEAMASGCLVIGSRTAPVEEVITDGRNGLLVDFFDKTALTDRVDEALRHPDRFKKMRAAARETVVARYDLKSICLPRQLGLIHSLMRQA